ncbi:MAG: hypothetical protein E6R03_03360 [Hyphomicrobiaceae bacterium]|nr:MAG: hypothetical protein E6R03_03360 [Hyphomicrobiaceae bacterium]
MITPVSITLVKGPRLPDDVMQVYMRNLENLAGQEQGFHVAAREKITATWVGDKPQFYGVLTRGIWKIGLAIYPGGAPIAKKKYYWVGRGTRVRYAHMTSDFEAKTAVRFIGSYPGKGGFLRLGRPLKGISARSWDHKLAEDREEIVSEGIKQGFLNLWK